MLVILRESIWNNDNDNYYHGSSIGLGPSSATNRHASGGTGEILSVGSRMQFASRPETDTTKVGSATLKSAGDVQRSVQFAPAIGSLGFESASDVEMNGEGDVEIMFGGENGVHQRSLRAGKERYGSEMAV